MKNNNISVLVVDDDAIIRSIICEYLTYQNFRCFSACDSSEGLELFKKHKPDVVISDLVLPGSNGLEFLESIKEINPETPVIIITGLGVYEDAINALKRGAWDYIAKPVDMRILLYSVNRVIERSFLIIENRKYQEQLEQEVEIRTRQLYERTKELEYSNNLLREEIKRRVGSKELIN